MDTVKEIKKVVTMVENGLSGPALELRITAALAGKVEKMELRIDSLTVMLERAERCCRWTVERLEILGGAHTGKSFAHEELDEIVQQISKLLGKDV